jgi:nucleoside-diphosphate-sugar epimerase
MFQSFSQHGQFMKIAITGAAGNAGQAVCQHLAQSGKHELQLGDVAGAPDWLSKLGRYHRCDTRTVSDVNQLIDGADAVIHLAAWHCAHQPPVSDETIFSVNVDGTFNVIQACRANKIKTLVFASSMAYGKFGIYGASKVIGEDLVDTYHNMTRAAVVNLRYHEFLPCPYLRYGQKLLHNGVDRQDVARATVACVEAAAAGKITNLMTVVHHHLAAPPEVILDFGNRGAAWLESKLPGTGKLLEKYGLTLPETVEQHDMSESERLTGWLPQVNFLTFLADLKRRDTAGEDVRLLQTTGELPA